MKKDFLLSTLGVVAGTSLLGVVMAKAYPSIKVAEEVPINILSEPVKIEVKINGEKVKTPASLTLKPGTYTIEAPKVGIDLFTQYDFYAWYVNGKIASYSPKLEIEVKEPVSIKALYILAGSYPEFIVL